MKIDWKNFQEVQPAEIGGYLVLTEIFSNSKFRTYRNMQIAWWTLDKRWFSGMEGLTVTHWCELPDIPEEYGGSKDWNISK